MAQVHVGEVWIQACERSWPGARHQVVTCSGNLDRESMSCLPIAMGFHTWTSVHQTRPCSSRRPAWTQGVLQPGIACGARPHNQHNATLAYCMLHLGMGCGLDPDNKCNPTPPHPYLCTCPAHMRGMMQLSMGCGLDPYNKCNPTLSGPCLFLQARVA